MFSKPLKSSVLFAFADMANATHLYQRDPASLEFLGLSEHNAKTPIGGHSLLGYEDSMHMDAFSIDHHSGLSDIPLTSSATFGFGGEGMSSFNSAFSSVDDQLQRLHEQYDAPAKTHTKISGPPKFAFDESKIDAPVAGGETKEEEKAETKVTITQADGSL